MGPRNRADGPRSDVIVTFLFPPPADFRQGHPMLRNLLISSLMLFLPLSTYAGDLAADTAAKKLNQSLTELQSMQARFEQWVADKSQTTLQHVTGSMWIQRPGQFRWDTDEPYPQQIVSDGKTLLIYDKDLEQATR